MMKRYKMDPIYPVTQYYTGYFTSFNDNKRFISLLIPCALRMELRVLRTEIPTSRKTKYLQPL